jgi:phenylpyruvate tautomerase PptA (4-oxalocrotonate tautomerase family)
MPFVRISVLDDTPVAIRRAIGAGVQAAMAEVAGVPPGERFQLVTGYPVDAFFFDRSFGGSDRQRVVLIEITLVRTLGDETKRALFRRIVENLIETAGVRPDDTFVVLTENGIADWSQGGGEASLLPR